MPTTRSSTNKKGHAEYCHRCNYLQSFVVHVRDEPQGRWQERYIKCSMCRWERVIGHTSELVEAARERERRLLERVTKEAQRNGKASAQTIIKCREATHHRYRLESNLVKAIREQSE